MNPYTIIARPQAAALRSVIRGRPNSIHPTQTAIVATVCTLIRRADATLRARQRKEEEVVSTLVRRQRHSVLT